METLAQSFEVREGSAGLRAIGYRVPDDSAVASAREKGRAHSR